jgi:hydroxypyruvate isomerase
MSKLNAHLGYQFTEFEPLERFTQAARAGFKAVEWPAIYPYDPLQLKEIIDAQGLEWIQVTLPLGDARKGEKGLAALPDREEEFIHGLREAIRYANALGASWIHPMAGLVSDWDETTRRTYLKNVRRVAEEAADHGLGTLIEVLSAKEMPGYAMSSYERAEQVITEIGSDFLYLLLDTYHAQIITGDAIGVAKDWADRIGHVQIADIPGRHEPGTGSIDFDRFFGVLESAGYDGWAGCEYKPINGTLQGMAYLRRYL